MKNPNSILIALAILSIRSTYHGLRAGRAQDGPPEQHPEASLKKQPQTTIRGGASQRNSWGQVSTMHGDGNHVEHRLTVNTPVIPGRQAIDRGSVEGRGPDGPCQRDATRPSTRNSRWRTCNKTRFNIQLASGLIDFSAFQRHTSGRRGRGHSQHGRASAYLRGFTSFRSIPTARPLLSSPQGEAEVLTNDGSTKVEAGQMIQIHGSDHPEYKIDPGFRRG